MKTLLAVLLMSLLSFAQSPTKGGQPSASTGNNVFSSKATFSAGLNATSVNGINFADQFASEQAAVTAQVKGAVLNANGTYTTDPTNTALNKILLDFNDSYFANHSTDHTGLRFYCNISNANTLTQANAPYECLMIENHAAAANSGGALHYAGLKILPTADAGLADGNAVYGLYVNGIINQTTATSVTQHAAVEATMLANGGAGNASGIWGGDFHVSKPSGGADGTMIGLEIGMHKVPALGAASNWGLLIHSDDNGSISSTTRAGDAIRIGGTTGWTNGIDYVDPNLGFAVFLVDQNGKTSVRGTGTAFVADNQAAGQGAKVQYNDATVNKFATGLDASNDYVILDQVSSRNRFLANTGTNASTNINANGSGQVVLNNLGTGGVLLPSVAFASLPASSNGTVFYCSDCKNVVDNAATAGAACAGSGNGAFAKRENGRWDCN